MIPPPENVPQPVWDAIVGVVGAVVGWLVRHFWRKK